MASTTRRPTRGGWPHLLRNRPAKVNLIPFNPFPANDLSPFRARSGERIPPDPVARPASSRSRAARAATTSMPPVASWPGRSRTACACRSVARCKRSHGCRDRQTCPHTGPCWPLAPHARGLHHDEQQAGRRPSRRRRRRSTTCSSASAICARETCRLRRRSWRRRSSEDDSLATAYSALGLVFERLGDNPTAPKRTTAAPSASRPTIRMR